MCVCRGGGVENFSIVQVFIIRISRELRKDPKQRKREICSPYQYWEEDY